MRRLLLISIISLASLHAGNVIFIHPDGAGVAPWQAARMISKGPDGELAWDRLPQIAIYRGHLKDSLTSSSNGGATVHAYGVKVPADAFGTGDSADAPPVSSGGEPTSLMLEAQKAGIRTGLINSGSIIEPGTACFVASAKALELFGNRKFFLVVEEDGTDNFGNYNNAPGMLAALLRADEAFRESLAFLEKHPGTLIITAADSEAGGMDVIGLKAGSTEQPVIANNGRDPNGAPYDGLEGRPFESAPDRFGLRHPFVVTWASRNDTSGGIVIRAAGAGSESIRGTMDNTDIYKTMRAALFKKEPEQALQSLDPGLEGDHGDNQLGAEALETPYPWPDDQAGLVSVRRRSPRLASHSKIPA